MDRVLFEKDGPIATVTLNRPDKLNGLDIGMFDGIVETVARIRSDSAIRCVILRGAGRAFSAGLDFKSFMASPPDMQRLLQPVEGSVANLAQFVSWAWQEVEVPVIAAVHGITYGGGLQIALGADLRFVAPDAELRVLEIIWGLVPDMGITQTLLRVVRPDVAKELTFTGRKVAGEEAATLGLATKLVDDPYEAALETARVIAEKSPQAIRAIKKLYIEGYATSPTEGLGLEVKAQLGLLGSPNQMEAMKSGMTGEPAKFSDPSD
ncbi:MAG: crotonase/enoyl-CoA hydratase family protein [Myxococcota bacterium]